MGIRGGRIVGDEDVGLGVDVKSMLEKLCCDMDSKKADWVMVPMMTSL
jgi:hypothetical protein